MLHDKKPYDIYAIELKKLEDELDKMHMNGKVFFIQWPSEWGISSKQLVILLYSRLR